MSICQREIVARVIKYEVVMSDMNVNPLNAGAAQAPDAVSKAEAFAQRIPQVNPSKQFSGEAMDSLKEQMGEEFYEIFEQGVADRIAKEMREHQAELKRMNRESKRMNDEA